MPLALMNWRLPLIQLALRLQRVPIWSHVSACEEYAEYTVEQKQKLQQELLENILLHAGTTVPYYKELLRTHGVFTHDSIDIESFSRLPILTKDILRVQGNNMYADDHEQRGSYQNSSGGSTGEPVVFIQDKDYDAVNNATKIFFNKRIGKLPGEPEIKLWGSDRDIIEGNLTLKDRIINKLYNRKFYNSYYFSKEHIDQLIELHNSFTPASYWAYVDAMTEFARYILRNNVSVHSPKHIITSIGPLYEEARTDIEKAFHCKVYNQYGSREVGVCSIDSPHHEDMDIFYWRLLFEIVPTESGNPSEGKVLLTTLNNFSMPLIRYDIGDVAMVSDQPDASFEIGGVTSHVKIKNIIGRTLGFFKKEDGTLVHSHHMVQQMFFREWIKQFQFVQDTYDTIRCRIVLKDPTVPPKQVDLDDITQKIQALTGTDMRIAFEFPDEIERSRSGKYIYTVCNIQ